MHTAPGQPAVELHEMVMRVPASTVTRVIVGVDGSAGAAAAVLWAAPGRVNWYCLQHGRGPLVFVPTPIPSA